jgi:prefoldin alpha subunit
MSDEKISKEEQEKQKKAQELYMQMSMINQQSQELQKQIQSFEETIQEVEESKKSLLEISNTKEDNEFLVPIVSGIFAKAKSKDFKKFIVNVGGNVAVEKPIEKVQALLEKQLSQMQEAQHQFVDQLQKLTVQGKQIEVQLQELMIKG